MALFAKKTWLRKSHVLFSIPNPGKFGAVAEGVRRRFLGFPVRGVLLYQSLKMIKKGPPNGKFSIYPAHPFLICTVQYCPRFHFPEFDGRSKACSSTRHAAWALEKTRRRPPFVPSPCLYDPCIGQYQTAHVRAHKPPPRGGWRHKA